MALRDFSPASADDRHAAADLAVDEQPTIAVVGTNGDGLADWLAAGRGTARLLLRAVTLGIAASPLNQVIDDAAPRQKLRAHLGLVGFPQMVLRLRYAQMTPTTGRRPIEDDATIIDD